MWYDVHMDKICAAKTCDQVISKKRKLCDAHQGRWRKGERGAVFERPVRRKSPGEWGPWYVDKNTGYVRRFRNSPGRSIETQAQHRVMMEEMLGRSLVKGENVHHKNGNRADNRSENLELWNTSQPAGQRPEDKVAYAIEMLRLYSPELLA